MTRSQASAVAVALAALVVSSMAGPYVQFLAASVIVYLLVAVGLTVLTGYGGYVSIGHAAFWAIGAYGSTITEQSMHLPFGVSVLAGSLLAAAAGAIVAIPALRVRGHYLAIATMGFSLLVQQILFEWESLTGGRQGLFAPRPTLFGNVLQDDLSYLFLLVPIALAVCWIVHNFCRSFSGRSLLALKSAEVAAQCSGLNRAKCLLHAFTLSAFCAGLSGALYAHLIGYLSADTFTFATSVAFLTMVVIGGAGSLWGALFGAIFLTLLPELLRSFGNAQTAVYGVALILCVRFLPGGIAELFDNILRRMRQRKLKPASSISVGVADGPT